MHPTTLEVDLAAIRHNVAAIRDAVKPAEVMAIVKADGYGHGAVPVARAALAAGATRLAVAHVSEGVALRQAGITAPIQVFGGFFREQMPAFVEADLEFTIITLDEALALATFALQRNRRVAVHVKFDTGMGRVGLPWHEAAAACEKLKKIRLFALTGLMTHFATADERDKTFAHEQLRRFRIVIEAAQQHGLAFRYRHAANSGAILDLPGAHLDLVRAGVSMYGYYPSTETSERIALQPALTWRSHLVQVKRVAAGTPISYGCTWRASQETVIGTIPVGYADGYNRRLSNKMHVVIGGRRVPVIGRVCMDMIHCDLGPESTARAGDEVVLLGRQGKAAVEMAEFCAALETIPYEITCMISKRVPRIYRNQAE